MSYADYMVRTCRACRIRIEYGVYCSPCVEVKARRMRGCERMLRVAFPSLPAVLLRKLARADLFPGDVATMTDEEVLTVRSIGVSWLRKLRAVVPPPPQSGVCNWVGEDVPVMAGGA